jgi:hypothetical protein
MPDAPTLWLVDAEDDRTRQIATFGLRHGLQGRRDEDEEHQQE